MKYRVLLLEDVTNYGRKGDIVDVPPGFARNHLLPKAIALLASFATVKQQENLQKERAEQAKVDLVKAEKLAQELHGKKFETIVKVDHDGHMYGSVSVQDIVELLFNNGVEITKKQVVLHMPIKSLGVHKVALKLPEEVTASVSIEVQPDRVIKKKEEKKEEVAVESEEETNEEQPQESN